MSDLLKREILMTLLIEQELSSCVWEDFTPNIPADATPQEAMQFARSALEREYACIELDDLETLYKIFIAQEDHDTLIAMQELQMQVA